MLNVFHDLLVALFSTAAGFTASGIVSNIYRLVIGKAANDGKLMHTAHVGVMVIAGPSVMFENAMNSLREKSCSMATFWLSVAVSGYWSLAIGLIIMEFAIYFVRH